MLMNKQSVRSGAKFWGEHMWFYVQGGVYYRGTLQIRLILEFINL